MKYLFVHHNFPGHYLHIIRHLIAQPGNDVAFITQSNKNAIAGVRRVDYRVEEPKGDTTHPAIRHLNLAMLRADEVRRMAGDLKRTGFTPDIIIGHHGWGELLNLVDVWPATPILGYFEFYYLTHGSDVGFDPEFPITDDHDLACTRAMNAINLLALALDQHGQTPTRWQRDLYPAWAREQIRMLPEGVRLDICKPDPRLRHTPFGIGCKPFGLGNFFIDPGDKLVTYVARNLEPYRGFHVMMRALPELLSARPDVKVVMLGGDDVSYGSRIANTTWREQLQRELAGKYDASRVLMPGAVPYSVYVRLLQRSDAHVYLTYPFVLSWSLREAMACGCAIIGADVDPVREFITEGKTGVLTPCLDPKRLTERILELLEDGRLGQRIRAGARAYAEQHLAMSDHIAAYESTIAELTGQEPRARSLAT